MRLLIALFVLFMLAGVPGAHAAPCLKQDCSQDPQAWADMMGTSPEQRREQQIARDAARAIVQAQKSEDVDAFIGSIGIKQRYRLLYTIEDTFSRLLGKPYTVISAVVLPRGAGYLFCGSGFYEGGGGVFVFDTRPGGFHTLTATRQSFASAGCNDTPAVKLR